MPLRLAIKVPLFIFKRTGPKRQKFRTTIVTWLSTLDDRKQAKYGASNLSRWRLARSAIRGYSRHGYATLKHRSSNSRIGNTPVLRINVYCLYSITSRGSPPSASYHCYGAPSKKRKTKYARWHSYDGASTITLCEPCTEVRYQSTSKAGFYASIYYYEEVLWNTSHSFQ